VLSQSADGINWRQDPRPLGYNAQLVAPGVALSTGGQPIIWQGRRWYIGVAAPFSSGGALTSGVITMTPLSEDARRFEAEPSVLFGHSQGWELDTGASPFGPDYLDFRSGISAIIGKDGQIYVAYQGVGDADLNTGVKASAGAFGIAVGS
jgi:hypothetical protein